MSLDQSDKNDVRQIVREETAGMRGELRRLGVLFEDLNAKFDAVIEMLSKNLNVKGWVGDHEERVTTLEVDSRLIKSTVAAHSKQLKSLA